MAVLAAVDTSFGHADDSRDPTDAQAIAASLLEKSARRWSEVPGIRAALRCQVDLPDQRFSGSGVYLQKGTGHDLQCRWEWKLQADTADLPAAEVDTFLQVQDRRYLWSRSDFGGSTMLRRIDLQRVRRRLADSPVPTDTFAASNWLPSGLPQLLLATGHAFCLSDIKTEMVDNSAAWTLEGPWCNEYLARIFPDRRETILSEPSPTVPEFPPHLPDTVRIILLQDDLQPVRIEFLNPRAAEQSGNVNTPMVLLEWSHFRVVDTLSDSLFAYSPGDQLIVDDTQRYLAEMLHTAPEW